MEKELNGEQRREKLVSIMQQADAAHPVSGTALGNATGVSRQVVVQDIALLRMSGVQVVSSARGYYINQPVKCVRRFKMQHTNEQIEEELNTIVDLGGCVLDVEVNHRTYGKMSGTLNIKSRRDVREFLEAIRTGKSTPLLNITSGYHFHHISADSQEILDEIEEELAKKNFLAQFLPYEATDAV